MIDEETSEEVPTNVMIHKPAEREAQWVQANREELVERSVHGAPPHHK